MAPRSLPSASNSHRLSSTTPIPVSICSRAAPALTSLRSPGPPLGTAAAQSPSSPQPAPSAARAATTVAHAVMAPTAVLAETVVDVDRAQGTTLEAEPSVERDGRSRDAGLPEASYGVAITSGGGGARGDAAPLQPPSGSGRGADAADLTEAGAATLAAGCYWSAAEAPDAAAAAVAAVATAAATLTVCDSNQGERPKKAGKHQQSKPSSGPGSNNPKPKSTPRLARMEDADELDELLGSVYDNEEELVAKLMLQLQGLSHKQMRMYGIWDGNPEGGKRAFLEQWRRRHAERRAMVAALRDPATPPAERMALRTSYILRWRKVLFSCPHCWLLPGLCVCGRMRRFAPQRTRVVVHAHHGEWGSASNSGSILPTSLEGSEILLYSHPEHDERMRALLNDPDRTTALLWPGANSLLPEQLAAIAAERSGGRITVVALDATWGNARRMAGWFPKGTLTVRLSPESTLKDNKLSLLRPVRRYRGDLESGRVSTVEAVASLLYELEGDEVMYRGLLENLKIKVDGCRLQKNRTLVYDTHTPEQPSARHRWRGEKGRAAPQGQEDGDSSSKDSGGEGAASQSEGGASEA